MDPSTKKEMSIWSYDILILDVFSTALKIILRLIFCGRAKRDHTIWFSEFRFMGKWCLLCKYGKEKWVKSGGNGSTGVVDERSEETRLVRLRKSPTIKVVQQKKIPIEWKMAQVSIQKYSKEKYQMSEKSKVTKVSIM